jgi:extracellular matrix regulatory protein A
MELKLLSLGFGNSVIVSRIVAILSPDSSPMKRLKDEAKTKGLLVDATHGRKTRSIIITDSHHVILSAVQSDTIAQRLAADDRVERRPPGGSAGGPQE